LVWVTCVKYLLDGWWLLLPVWAMMFALCSEKVALVLHIG
jgi:hypothetical protein